MLFFIDETWQTIAGRRVGALGAVAIPQDQYNGFCGSMYAMKKKELGASELMHSEIKGQSCFAKSAFKRQALHGDSVLLKAADRLLYILAVYQARVFVIWTTHPDLLTLRHAGSTAVSKPYKQLLFDFRALMENEAPGRLDRSRETLAFGSNPRFGQLNFDLR